MTFAPPVLLSLYRDLFPRRHSGRYFPLLYSRSAIRRATTQRIVLVPRQDQP